VSFFLALESAADATIIKDNVISQTPTADSSAKKNDTVDLVVSSGPAETYVQVPDLHGKTVDVATALLTNAGLKLGSKDTANTNDATLKDTIKTQSIQPDQKVKNGTAISVTYYVYVDDTMVQVPKIDYIDGADVILNNAGLSIGTSTAKDTKVESDDNKVYSMSPAAGTSVKKGTKVNIVYWNFK